MNRSAVEAVYHRVTWGNTTETPEDWWSIVNGTDDIEKERLFGRIFREDSTGEGVKALFQPQDWLRYLSRLEKPLFRPDQERRRLVWRAVYLDIPTEIPGLTWYASPRETS